MVLLIGAQAIQSGTFTVGDLGTLRRYILTRWLGFRIEIGPADRRYERIDVSFTRMNAIVPGERPDALVGFCAGVSSRQPSGVAGSTQPRALGASRCDGSHYGIRAVRAGSWTYRSRWSAAR